MVLALRADFYGQAAAHPELLAALRDSQLLVEPMTPDELRAAVDGPAAAAGLVLDEGLADVILHEFGATTDRQPAAGALPLLSHVLWATWLRRSGSRLTVAQYRAAGGIAEAIKTTADSTYDGLDPQGREAVRLMLPRLVRVGEDTADTAQPVDRSALLHGLPDTAAAQLALDRFTRARLITLDHDSARISHEALLRAWPLLTEWVDADREWLRARQHLVADARAWERAGRESSLLYRGSRLAAVRERAASSADADAPDSVLAEFVDASWRQERRGARRTRIAVAFLMVLVVLATSGLIGSVIFQHRAERSGERDLARYLAAEAEDLREQQPGLAKQLSLVSYRMDKEAGRGALLNSRRSPGVINADERAEDLAYSGDGRVLAISVGAAIELRFQDGSARVEAGLTGPVTISRDGRTLAAVTYVYQKTGLSLTILSGAKGGESTLQESGMVLFDPGSPRRLLQATDHGVRVSYLNNSAQPGAERLLPLTPGTGAQFDYRVVGGKKLIALQGVRVNYLLDATSEDDITILSRTRSPDMFTGADIALSPDGSLLADVEAYENGKTAPDGTKQETVGVRLRSTSAAEGTAPLATIEDLDNGVAVIAFSPTEPVLAVSDMNGFRDRNVANPSVRIYDIANPGHPRQIARIDASCVMLAFSPDGKSLLLTDTPFADKDGTRPTPAGELESWDFTDPAHPKQRWARSSEAAVNAAHIAFRPDGKLLAIYDIDGTLRLWRVEGHQLTEELSRVSAGTDGSTMAFSPDGTRLALMARKAVGDDERPEIWDLIDPKNPRRGSYLPSSLQSVYALRFTPDGEYLALVRASSGVELWDTNPDRAIGDICASAGDPITRQQWKHYLPDKPYEPPCPPS
ncbi:hypothetical protein PL81_41170 [Streptomyces sp. RSD-27]|nr:hypothetical protein PL81_41170 [Streptomyces sp. RSD-27]